MSPIDSPRESCISSPRRTIGVAPSSATPTSKEIRVRVEGLSKTSAMLRPASSVAPAPSRRPAFSSAARSSSFAELEGAELFTGEEVALQDADTTPVEFTAISWNLFHGRDFPPDPALRTWRSRLLRITERNATHVQVNRDLRAEFAAMLAGWEWDVALLQECPPRWSGRWPRACGAEAQRRAHLAQLAGAAARASPPASTPT